MTPIRIFFIQTSTPITPLDRPPRKVRILSIFSSNTPWAHSYSRFNASMAIVLASEFPLSTCVSQIEKLLMF